MKNANLVDSSGWIEYFKAGANAGFFTPPILDTEYLIVPTICIYEVFKRILLEWGEEPALLVIGYMAHGKEIHLNRQIALDAAHISVERKLAMADSLILATAQANQAILWTQDEHFKDIEGVKFILKK
jgi:predicted nucleic acid-binding protein